MGQNSSHQGQSYNSKQFFQEQVDFYRWRADTSINTHICRIVFHLQQSL